MELAKIEDIRNEIENAITETIPLKQQAIKHLELIIKKMPPEIRNFIEESFIYKRIPKEYLVSSILFAFSNAAGLAFKTDVLGHENYGNLYFANVGSRGDTKSLAIDLATDPLNNFDNMRYNDYKNQENNEGQENVFRKQLFLQDATIESALNVHHKNPYSIGILNDELSGLLHKMSNKNSNEGSMWRVFFLQGFTNKHVDISRKTTESFRIEKSYPTLLGSLQNEFIRKLFADGNLESGFIDRILFTTKLTQNNVLSRQNISLSILEDYAVSLTNVLTEREFIQNECDRFSTQLIFADESEIILFDYLQDLTDKQNKLGNFLNQYNAKMQISIHKLILLVHLIKNAKIGDFNIPISIETVELAILINEFYFTNFKIVVEENILCPEKIPTLDEIIKFAIKNGLTQNDVVQFAKKDKSIVSRHWNKLIQLQLATQKTQ